VDKPLYIRTLRNDAEKIAQLARTDIDVSLPSCPGWTLSSLVAHLGSIYTEVAKNITEGQGQDVVQSLEDLGLPPDIHAWFAAKCEASARPAGVTAWFAEAASRLIVIFEQSDPGQPAWTWFAPQQNVGFWMRRMANETSIHRWDGQTAFGKAEPIDAHLAADGIDEMLTVYAPQNCRPQSTLDGRGETYRFSRSDGAGEWTVRFQERDTQVGPRAGDPDVVITGTASDLVLFLWHRISAESLAVSGDGSLVSRYFELLPPD
jgi:uncharacterized protein (TIGR03083 family)